MHAQSTSWGVQPNSENQRKGVLCPILKPGCTAQQPPPTTYLEEGVHAQLYKLGCNGPTPKETRRGVQCPCNPQAGMHGPTTTTTNHLPRKRGACPTPEDGMHGPTTSTNHLPRRRGACQILKLGCNGPTSKVYHKEGVHAQTTSWDARPNNQTCWWLTYGRQP